MSHLTIQAICQQKVQSVNACAVLPEHGREHDQRNHEAEKDQSNPDVSGCSHKKPHFPVL
jgi:hypothetical protein